jgi:hypothetical protein
MIGEPFTYRLRQLRDTWSERRQTRSFAATNDFLSRFELLLCLYDWSTQAIAEVSSVYSGEIHVGVSPRPEKDDPNPAFNISVAEQYLITFAVTPRSRGRDETWQVVVSIFSNGPHGTTAVPAGPERRTGQWTRGRLEDVLLSVLSAWERSVTEGDGFGGGRVTAVG